MVLLRKSNPQIQNLQTAVELSVMDTFMDRHQRFFRALLVVAFVSQVVIDALGFTGFYYSMYEPEVFSYAGHGALASFEWAFGLYIFGTLAYYLSIVSMALFHRTAWVLIPLALVLSFVQQPISGVYVGTPFELTVSWIGWAAYYVCIGLWFCSTPANRSIHDNLENQRDPKP